MNLAKPQLASLFKQKYGLNGKRLAFDLRWMFFCFYSKLLFHAPLEFNPFHPGLEMKFALEEATKANSNVVFLGYEFNRKTIDRMYHENRYTVVKALYNTLKLASNMNYSIEMKEYCDQVNSYGIKKFLESSCDQYFVNW